jgi:hypothetical protein
MKTSQLTKNARGFRRWSSIAIGLILGVLLAACSIIQSEIEPQKKIEPSGVEWDYLPLGDHWTASAEWPEIYAAYIEADLGVTVTIHNWASGEQTSATFLEMLQENSSLRAQVHNAEVVTLWTGGYIVSEALTSHRHSCDPELVAAFGTDLESILDEIIALRRMNGTIIRLLEFFQPRVNILDEMGILGEKKICLTALNERVHQAAFKYEIPVASVHRVFNGPDGSDDAADRGYLTNIRKFSLAGETAIADLLRELGYEPQSPKRWASED